MPIIIYEHRVVLGQTAHTKDMATIFRKNKLLTAFCGKSDTHTHKHCNKCLLTAFDHIEHVAVQYVMQR